MELKALLLLCLLLFPAVFAANVSVFKPKADIDMEGRYNIFNVTNMTGKGLLNWTGTAFVANSQVCTASNAVCSAGTGNASWNQSYANTLYAPIGGGGNSSWNETRANSLYANFTYVNSQDAVNGNFSSNNASLWAGINACYTNDSRLETKMNSLGNWSADSANYATKAYANSQDAVNGNFSANNASLWASINSALTNITNAFSNDSRLETKMNSLGNWSADSGTYAQKTYVNSQDVVNGNFSANNASIWQNASDQATLLNTKTTQAVCAAMDAANGNYTLNPAGYYNITTLPGGTGDNASWNQSYAQAMFYNKTQVDTLGNWSKNVSAWPAASCSAGTQVAFWDGGKITCVTTGAGDNTSWNESYARTLFALIGSGSDNTSWNQSGADLRYYPISTNPLGFINRTNSQLFNDTTLINTVNTSTDATWRANATGMRTLVDDARTNISNLWTNASDQATLLNTKTTQAVCAAMDAANGNFTSGIAGAVGQNLTYTKVNDSFGNWSQDKSGYYSKTQADTVGNWSKNVSAWPAASCSAGTQVAFWDGGKITCVSTGAGDNTSWNESKANGLYYPISTNPLGFINSTNSQLYNETTLINTVNTSTDAAWRANATAMRVLLDDARTNISNLWTNATNQATLINSKVSDNSSWNETYADGRYYLVSNGSLDNRSWNQSYARAEFYNKTQVDTIGNFSALNALYSYCTQNSTVARQGNCPAGQFWNGTSPNGTPLCGAPSGVAGITNNSDAILNNLTVSQNLYLTNPLAACSGDNYYMVQYAGNYSVCRSVNQTAFNLGNFTKNASTWITCTRGNYSWWNGSAMDCAVDLNNGGVGDNTSWNQSGADLRYYPISTNPLSFINSTNSQIFNDTALINTVNTSTDAAWRANATGMRLLVDDARTNISNLWTNASDQATLINTKFPSSGIAGAVGNNVTTAYINSQDAVNGNFSANNASIWQNASDQATLINSKVSDNASWNETKGYSLFATQNTTVARTGNCPNGYVEQNDTTSGPQCYPLSLSYLNDTLASKTFNFANKDLNFSFNLGSFFIDQIGAFSNELVHIHQHTGNPTSGAELLRLEAADVDVLLINATGTKETAAIFNHNITIGGNRVSTIGTCADGTFVQNTTTGGVQCAAPSGVAGITNDSDGRLNNLTVAKNFYLTSPLSACSGDNYYMVQYAGNYSICRSVNQTAFNLGNWSADKSAYNITSDLNSAYYPRNLNPNGYYNVTTLPGGTGDNASWNQSYANTLYFPIAGIAGAVGANLTWATVTGGVGNFSANNASIWQNATDQLTLINTKFPTTGIAGAVGDNTTYAIIQARINNNGNYTLNPAGYYNVTTLPYASSAAGWQNNSNYVWTVINNVNLTNGTLTVNGTIKVMSTTDGIGLNLLSGGGSYIGWGTNPDQTAYLRLGAWGGNNNLNTTSRDLWIVNSSTVVLRLEAATGKLNVTGPIWTSQGVVALNYTLNSNLTYPAFYSPNSSCNVARSPAGGARVNLCDLP